MKTNYKVPSSHVIIYFGAALVGHYLAGIVSLKIAQMIIPYLSDGSQSSVNFWGYVIIPTLTFLFSWLIGFFLFKYYTPQQFEKRASENCWKVKALKMMAPIEIARMIICFPLRVPYITAQFLAPIPVIMFDYGYLVWVGHYYAVRQQGILTFGDRLAFLLCFLLCEAIYIPVMLLIYRYWWKKTQKEYEIEWAEMHKSH